MLDSDAHLELIEKALAEELTYDERIYQPSVLNIVGGQLEGAYYGPDAETPYVIQGIRSLLSPSLAASEIDTLLAETEKNYVIYNHAGYQPGLEHITEEVVQAVAGDDSDDAGGPQPQAHAFTDGIKYVWMVPVADDTIYDPDTTTWVFSLSNWVDRMEAAANRASLFWTFAQVAFDIPANQSSLAVDNNRMLLRMVIPEYRVLTVTGKAALVHPTDGCGGTGTFRDNIRSISNSTLNYDNEFWLWSTQDNFTGGGCAYSQAMGLSPRGTTDCDFIDGRNYPACGSVGYIELRSGHTTDWTSLVVIHDGTFPQRPPRQRQQRQYWRDLQQPHLPLPGYLRIRPVRTLDHELRRRHPGLLLRGLAERWNAEKEPHPHRRASP